MGAGSWGTALSVLLHDNGHHVTDLVDRSASREVRDAVKRRESMSKAAGGAHLRGNSRSPDEMQEAIQGKDFLVLAVPSPFTRATAKKMQPYVGRRADDR